MRYLTLSLFLVGLLVVTAEARVCQYPYETVASTVTCPAPNTQTFTTQDLFIAWAKANPQVEYKIIYSTANITGPVRIIYYPLCTATATKLFDKLGECTK